MNSDSMKTILAGVEEMGLSDGAYLEFANLMKKEFEKKEKEGPKLLRTKDINRTVKFGGTKLLEVSIQKEYVYVETANRYDYTIGYGTTHDEFYENKELSLHKIGAMYMANLTKEIVVEFNDYDVSFTTNMKDHIQFVREYSKANSNPDDDDEYSLTYLIGLLLGIMDL